MSLRVLMYTHVSSRTRLKYLTRVPGSVNAYHTLPRRSMTHPSPAIPQTRLQIEDMPYLHRPIAHVIIALDFVRNIVTSRTTMKMFDVANKQDLRGVRRALASGSVWATLRGGGIRLRSLAERQQRNHLIEFLHQPT